MAATKSPLQQARDLLSNVGNSLNPTSNAGNNFWSSPVAQGLARFQQTNPLNFLSQAGRQYNQQAQQSLQSLPKTVAPAIRYPAKFVGNLGQGIQSSETQAMDTTFTGAKNFVNQGVKTISQIPQGPKTTASNLLGMVKPAAQTVLGFGSMVAGVNPLTIGARTLAAAPLDKRPQLLGNDVLNTAADMVAFSKNPAWEKMYPITSKILTIGNPGNLKGAAMVANGAIRHFVKGGVEGLMLGWSSLPDNLTSKQKADWLLSNIAVGGLSDVSITALGKSLGYVGKAADNAGLYDYLGKIVDKGKNEMRKLSTPVATMGIDPTTGKRVVEPMWKYQGKALLNRQHKGAINFGSDLTSPNPKMNQDPLAAKDPWAGGPDVSNPPNVRSSPMLSSNPSQRAIEDALNKNNFMQAQKLVNGLAEGDPYRKTMQVLIDNLSSASGNVPTGFKKGSTTLFNFGKGQKAGDLKTFNKLYEAGQLDQAGAYVQGLSNDDPLKAPLLKTLDTVIRLHNDLPTEMTQPAGIPPPLSPTNKLGSNSLPNTTPQGGAISQKGVLGGSTGGNLPGSVPPSPPPTGGSNVSSGGSIPPTDPVNKIIAAIKGAKPVRNAQEALYSAERSKRIGVVAGIGQNVPGEAGYHAQLGALKGELPKANFESIRGQVTQPDIDGLFNKVEQSGLTPYEKVTAKTGLAKLLGAGGGTVPQRGELDLLNQVFPPEFTQAVLDQRSTFQKLFSLAQGGLNLPRAIMATADFSAPLRQGAFLIGRPKQWIPAFKEQFKYFASPKAYEGLQQNIKARPTYPMMREAGLSLTDTSPVMGSREEMFMSNLTEKIPGFGKIAAGSNRAYSGFLNKLRADVFDDLVGSAQKQGVKVEGKTLQDIGNFVNTATGRGNLGALQRAAPLLNGALFSPRLVASRVNLLNPVYYAKLDPFVRKEALKSLMTFGGTALTTMGLAKLAGAQVGSDPRSSDFGKIKVGNTRYDVLGGFGQYIKLAAQLTTGQIVSSTTGKTMTLGEGYKPMTRKDILTRFFESKESPVASFVTGLLTGQDSIGNKFQATPEVISRFIPLIAQDAYDLVKEHGVAGLPMTVPGVFGVGTQTYGKQQLVTGKNQLGKPAVQLTSPTTMAQDISNKLIGAPPLGSTPQYAADAYFKQMLKMPKADAAQKFDQIAKSDPAIAKKIVQSYKDYKLGITVEDENLKSKDVASGDRAVAVADQFKKLTTNQEKAKLWEEYVKKGIITKEVAKQLADLLRGGGQ